MIDDQKEELKELNGLINENKRLIKKYPDKFSLKMGLKSLEARKKQIEVEIV
jgi:hypothetical protein